MYSENCIKHDDDSRTLWMSEREKKNVEMFPSKLQHCKCKNSNSIHIIANDLSQ